MIRFFALLLGCCWLASGFAQGIAPPDAGTILRDIQRALPVPEPKLPPPPPRLVPRAPDDTVFVVKRFDLRGITLIAPVEVQAALKPWLNREIVFADLEKALQAISELYQSRGWYVRPQIPEQDVIDGVVRIDIIEARLGALKFEQTDNWPISRRRIERTFDAQHPAGQSLNLTQMNRAVALLNELPGVGVKAALAEGTEPETTDVVISFDPKPRWSGSGSLDNQGARSTGYERVSLNFSWDNPGSIGDQVQSNLMASQGVRYVRLAYSLPIGYQGLRLAFNTSGMHYQLVGGFDTPGGTFGTAFTRGTILSYPLFRGQKANASLSFTFNDADYSNHVNGLLVSRKEGRTGTIGLSSDFYDEWMGGGTNLLGLNLTGGKVVTPSRKLTANAARLQRVTNETSIWLSFNGQRAVNNLDSSEKFGLGGAQYVRAYPGNQGNGDHGWMATLEGRQQLQGDLQGILFYDHGSIRLSENPLAAPPDNAQKLNLYSLRGWGVGVNYSLLSKTNVKLTWSRRIGNNPVANTQTGTDVDGTRLMNRFWVNVSNFF